MASHGDNANVFVRDEGRAKWHDESLWLIRTKRDSVARTVPEWEELRTAAAAIKEYTVANLPDLLERFETNARQRGAVVHWAADAAAHNRIVASILEARGVSRVVKSKSMLTEECGLNPYLECRGVEVVDTDLGERIVQLRNEPPSHIVMPAIHLRRQEVGELFARELGTEPGLTDPTRLTEAARRHLRDKFLGAEAGITGVNFAIAESGGIVVCTNEGNADLGTSLPPVHIACMGIEKLVPRLSDLAVFTRLLARSATGQPITAYTSHMNGPRDGAELHIVIVDNGRSELLAKKDYRQALGCIRCGACLNTCPVYRRSGGYSYESVIPGPIGSVLGAARDPARHQSLPYACTMCGSCTDVCPVKIDLHAQLFGLRRDLVSSGAMTSGKRSASRVVSWVLQNPRAYEALGSAARFISLRLPWLARFALPAWFASRDLPEMPKRSFRQQMEDLGGE